MSAAKVASGGLKGAVMDAAEGKGVKEGEEVATGSENVGPEEVEGADEKEA